MADKLTFNPITGQFDITADTSGLLKLDQTTPQTITGGIPVMTNLTPTTDYHIATKKYIDDLVAGLAGEAANGLPSGGTAGQWLQSMMTKLILQP